VNRSFLLREWGAVSFVLTVLVGVVAVPLALLFGNPGGSQRSNATVPTASAPASPGASSSASPTASPSPSR
jgi:hypothetical protein